MDFGGRSRYSSKNFEGLYGRLDLTQVGRSVSSKLRFSIRVCFCLIAILEKARLSHVRVAPTRPALQGLESRWIWWSPLDLVVWRSRWLRWIWWSGGVGGFFEWRWQPPFHLAFMAQWARNLQRFSDECQTHLRSWSIGYASEELLHPADVGGVTKGEEKVPALIAALLDNQAKLRIKHKSAVVRVWWMCRTAMSREEEIASGRIQQNSDAPLDQSVVDPCHDLWAKSRGYRILS